MIALTDRQRAVLRAALEARSGRELTPTEQRELGEALVGHLELASAWGAAACSDAEASEWWVDSAREQAALVEDMRAIAHSRLAEIVDMQAERVTLVRERDAANARADEWAARCRAVGDARDRALNDAAEYRHAWQRDLAKGRDRIAELERELAAAVRSRDELERAIAEQAKRDCPHDAVSTAHGGVQCWDCDATLRQPAPAEPARVPVAVGQVRREPGRWDVTVVSVSRDRVLLSDGTGRYAVDVAGWPLVAEAPEVDEPAQGDGGAR